MLNVYSPVEGDIVSVKVGCEPAYSAGDLFVLSHTEEDGGWVGIDIKGIPLYIGHSSQDFDWNPQEGTQVQLTFSCDKQLTEGDLVTLTSKHEGVWWVTSDKGYSGWVAEDSFKNVKE